MQVLPARPPSYTDSVSQPLSVRSCNVESTMFYDYFNNVFIKLSFAHKNYSPDFRGFIPRGFPDNVKSRGNPPPPPPSGGGGGVENFAGEIFLLGGGNPTMSDFNHSNLFQS